MLPSNFIGVRSYINFYCSSLKLLRSRVIAHHLGEIRQFFFFQRRRRTKVLQDAARRKIAEDCLNGEQLQGGGSMTVRKWVYSFNKNRAEGNQHLKELLGGKGANLQEMSSLGTNVPSGLSITTEACLAFEAEGEIWQDLKDQTLTAIVEIEKLTGKRFGDHNNPLLFSVRSGARVSMPGMMDTVLNLGMNDKTVVGLAKLTNNPRFAWDTYRRFIQMYANVVMGFNSSLLEANLEDLKEARGVSLDTELSAEDFEDLVSVYKDVILQETGHIFPQDPHSQLWLAMSAVFNSWNNNRAKKYRELNNIPHSWGTAVNVQTMVFGNMGDDCATGVCFTRDPSTGENVFFGEYLVNAQGEDVVAGIRTPAPINEASKNDHNIEMTSLEKLMPKVYAQLVDVYKLLEDHYKDMQDIEFTVEKNILYILQTRNGKRTAQAAVRIATEMVAAGVLSKDEALMRIPAEDLNQLLHPRLDPQASKTLLAKGLPASPGAVSGKIVFTSERAAVINEQGENVILVRQETSPEDISGMIAAKGILTARGGMTSHAAVVARGMGKTCIAGCSALYIDAKLKQLKIDGKLFAEGDEITLDGGTGEVFLGVVATITGGISSEFALLMSWADEKRKLRVRTNADNPADAKVAIGFGAEGIGLCRTEHMFFGPERVLAIREMIFANTVENRVAALEKLVPYQREDFLGIFNVMEGKPVNIRLLDPPLHEFLPHDSAEKEELAFALKIELAEVEKRCDQLFEFNPMLGHRGCRLGITYPEIYIMQVKAIINAAIDCHSNGKGVIPEIMIPLIGTVEEYEIISELVHTEVKKIFVERKVSIDYKVGTMIELPRAAIVAGKIANKADFFSFGTNDLTQTTFGLSRDDAGKFLPQYISKGILTCDPFVSLDREGVGFLVEHATVAGRKNNPKMHIGICGEHGGDPQSIYFCHQKGLDYVSCSPYRVPIARLAAAQASITYDQ